MFQELSAHEAVPKNIKICKTMLPTKLNMNTSNVKIFRSMLPTKLNIKTSIFSKLDAHQALHNNIKIFKTMLPTTLNIQCREVSGPCCPPSKHVNPYKTMPATKRNIKTSRIIKLVCAASVSMHLSVLVCVVMV